MNEKYYDLDIPLKSVSPQLIARLLDCGYQFLAVSQSVDIDKFTFSTESDSSVKKKSKEAKKEMRKDFTSQLQPPSLDNLNKLISECQHYRTTVWSPVPILKPNIFTRLTINCGDENVASHFFREFNASLTNFDIVSFAPSTPGALAYACEQTPNVDMLTIDVTRTSDLRVSNKQLSTIMSKGLHVEFHSAPLLRPNSSGVCARSVLSQYFTNIICGTNASFGNALVISSGAENGWEVRRPVAISAMLSCLGLRPREATYNAITLGPRAVVTHGLSRSRTLNGAALILRLMNMPNVTSIRVDKSNTEADKTQSHEPPYKQIKLVD